MANPDAQFPRCAVCGETRGICGASTMPDHLYVPVEVTHTEDLMTNSPDALATALEALDALKKDRDEQMRLGIRAECDLAMWKKSAEGKQRYINQLEAELAALRASRGPQEQHLFTVEQVEDAARRMFDWANDERKGDGMLAFQVADKLRYLALLLKARAWTWPTTSSR